MTLNEAKQLHIGCRVTLTDDGLEAGLQGRAETPHGTFQGMSRTGQSVRVKRDGVKYPASTYAPHFWRALERPKERPDG